MLVQAVQARTEMRTYRNMRPPCSRWFNRRRFVAHVRHFVIAWSLREAPRAGATLVGCATSGCRAGGKEQPPQWVTMVRGSQWPINCCDEVDCPRTAVPQASAGSAAGRLPHVGGVLS